MWIASKFLDHLTLLRADLEKVRAERDSLKSVNATLTATGDWLRVRVNALEYERAALMEKAFNITMPVPEIVRSTRPTQELANFSFEDIGDDRARDLGLPVYN